MRTIGTLIAALQWVPRAAAATKSFQWTMDNLPNLGPDGPWQAVWVNQDDDELTEMPMWPIGTIQTLVAADKNSGWYRRSEEAVMPRGKDLGGNETWPIGLSKDHEGATIFDSLRLSFPNYPGYTTETLRYNVSLYLEEEIPSGFVNVSNTARAAGCLGLGDIRHSPSKEILERNEWPDTILRRLWDDGKIETESWFMHMGSVPLGQPGSLTLGGYDSHRVVGDAGTFILDKGIPRVFLKDVLLGHEYGESPFDTDVGSVWKGIESSEIAMDESRRLGSSYNTPPSAALVVPNAAVPYIYLPPGTCEAAAEHLPVEWSSQNGMYMWNLDEKEKVDRIINSPAYMAFVFQGESLVTVKIPFKLLNLTLDELPGREFKWKERSYWPCKPWDLNDRETPFSEVKGRWQLGRAFLQGAFTGFNYDHDFGGMFYMAQAPGPSELQRELVDSLHQPIAGLPAETFADTWKSLWTQVKGGDSDTEMGTGGKAGNAGLGTGAKAGIGVGVVCGVAAAALAAFALIRRRSRKNRPMANTEAGAGEAENFIGGKPELDGAPKSPTTRTVDLEFRQSYGNKAINENEISELGSPTSHGFVKPAAPGETGMGDGMVFEMPADNNHNGGSNGK